MRAPGRRHWLPGNVSRARLSRRKAWGPERGGYASCRKRGRAGARNIPAGRVPGLPYPPLRDDPVWGGGAAPDGRLKASALTANGKPLTANGD